MVISIKLKGCYVTKQVKRCFLCYKSGSVWRNYQHLSWGVYGVYSSHKNSLLRVAEGRNLVLIRTTESQAPGWHLKPPMFRWHDLGRHVLPARHVRCESALVVDNGKTKTSLSRSSRTNILKSPANAIWQARSHLMKYGHYPTGNILPSTGKCRPRHPNHLKAHALNQILPGTVERLASLIH